MKARAATAAARSPSFVIRFAICAALVALIWIVFGQTVRHDFINYDDKVYVYGSPLVSSGISAEHVARAFVDRSTNNWHPLTLISHMLDCQLFDLKPAGHHFINVLLHSVAAILLLIWLSNLTGRFWSSAFVSALFAIHPLRVRARQWRHLQSEAWRSGRSRRLLSTPGQSPPALASGLCRRLFDRGGLDRLEPAPRASVPACRLPLVFNHALASDRHHRGR